MLIQTGTTPGLEILNDLANVGTAVASYAIWSSTGPIAGTGGFVGIVGGCFFTPTAGETAGTGQIIFLALDGGGAIVGSLSCQIVVWDPVAGPAGSDPWATPLPGAYGAGEAGKIVGTALDALVSSRSAPGAAMALTSGERDSVANALLDLANGVDVGVTLRHAICAMAAVMAGTTNNAGLAYLFRNWANTKNRVQVIMSPAGNRATVIFDFS